MDRAALIESGNFVYLIISLLAFYMVIKWRVSGAVTASNKEVVRAWLWIFGAFGFNTGWFAMSRHLAPEGSTWNPWMYEYRSVLILSTAFAFSWGMLKFIRLIEGYSTTWGWTVLCGVFIIAFILGVF